VVQNPELLPLQGKTHRGNRQAVEQGPHRHHLRLLIKDNAFTEVAVFGMSSRTCAGAAAALGFDRQRFAGHAPEGCSARSIRIRAPTARFRASCASTCAKRHQADAAEDAIRKFSALPAQRMRLADRGVLKQGMWADVVVFDPDHGKGN
jgi:N-acyl-D-amino-acid deacylase